MIRASDLLGCIVCTESGERLGHVHDLRAIFAGGGWQLIGLIVGRGGIRARFATGGEQSGDVVAWEAITRLDDGLIIVRDEIALSIS